MSAVRVIEFDNDGHSSCDACGDDMAEAFYGTGDACCSLLCKACMNKAIRDHNLVEVAS